MTRSVEMTRISTCVHADLYLVIFLVANNCEIFHF